MVMAKSKNAARDSKTKKSVNVSKKAFSQDYDDEELEEEELPKWYEEFPNDPEDFPEPTEELISGLRKEAQTLLESDISSHNIKSSRGPKQSTMSWIKTMVSSGTTADKIAALTLMIQESPIHNLNTLQNFINMVKIGKKECFQVIGTLTELFLADLLPPDRKLRVFAACPLTMVEKMSSGNQLSRSKHLIRWYYEDQLKQLYQEFLVHLNTAARDSIEANKEKAIVAMFKLIKGNPEKESFILSSLVNKLGDPSQKVGSKTIYCLMQLLHHHPAMKGVIMEEIEKLLFRPNVSKKAQYYGVCFLSQFFFSSYDGDVAKNLVRIYFSFFKSCVKKGEVDSRMMRVLLNGVNRAFPFINKETDDQISEHIEMLYKIVHVATFNVSLHALCLIFQVSDYNQSVSERFYNVLYKKLSDPQLATSSHHAMFFSLVFRALKKNDNASRGRVFLKRLLQECVHLPTHLACGVLFLTSQLIGNNKDLLPLLNEASKFHETEEDGSEEECYKDAPIEEELKVSLDISVEDLSHKLQLGNAEEKSLPTSTWYHVDSGGGVKKAHKTLTKYNSNTRNPLHSGGEHCVYTELTKLLSHFHPTVALFADTILSGKTIRYSGDPLLDFGLIKFLDRFVFKNPKKLTVFENLKPSPFGRKKNYTAKGLKSLAINSSNYLNESEDKIPVEERFLYQYLQGKRKLGKKVNTEDDEEESDMESVASDDFEEMMDGLMGGKKDLELDFADDVGDKLSSKQNNKKRDSKRKGEDDDHDEEFGDNEDDDEDEEEDEEFDDEGSDDDAEDIEFGDDGDDFELGDDFDINNISDVSDEEITSTKKKKGKTKKELSRFQGPNTSIFASADEFAQMLEESGASDLKMSGSSSLANKDNAAEKQMKWEVSRNNWITDDKWKNKNGKRKKGFSSSGNTGKKVRKTR